jgi:group I intron endonuclease
MNGVIYLATNKINGKKYVGLTRRSLLARWTQHVNVASKQAKTYFHKAIVKYGKECFDVQPIASALSLDALGPLEAELIRQIRPEYNQTNGGEVTLGRKYDDATKERIRVANTGKKRTKEQNVKNSLAKKQQYANNPILLKKAIETLNRVRSNVNEQKRVEAVRRAAVGRVWSEESKIKLSASCMGRRYSQDVLEKMKASKRKPILCSDGRLFTCAKEAAKLTGISSRSISRVCNGEYQSVKGIKFSYYRSLA